MDDDHPLPKTFIERDLGDGRAELTHEFKERIDSYRSHETFEVRLADIIGNVVRRISPRRNVSPSSTSMGKGCTATFFTGKEVDVPSPYEP